MQIDLKLEGVDKALKMLDPKRVVKAQNAAMTRASKSGVTEASRKIRAEYNVPARRVSEYLRISAQRTSGVVEYVDITGRGRGLALSYFGAKQTGVSTAKGGFRYTRRSRAIKSGMRYGGDVTVQVKRAGGRKVVNQVQGFKPFMARMKSGHLGVFVRRGKARTPIEHLMGPGIGGLFGTKGVMDATKTKVVTVFNTEFNRLLGVKDW